MKDNLKIIALNFSTSFDAIDDIHRHLIDQQCLEFTKKVYLQAVSDAKKYFAEEAERYSDFVQDAREDKDITIQSTIMRVYRTLSTSFDRYVKP